MESHFSEIEIINGHLVINIIKRSTKNFLAVDALRLFGSEYNLSGGRFYNYNDEVRTNRVVLSPVSFLDFPQGFANAISWIAEECEGEWAFGASAVDEPNILGIIPLFYFDDPTDSMLFSVGLLQRKNPCRN